MRPPHPPATDPVAARAEVLPGVWLDSRLALWLAAERLLVIADLHWGYALSHRARGNLLPAWGDREIGTRLDALIADYAPAAMLWLGDIVHAAEGATRADSFLRRTSVPVTLLAGNHDRRWPVATLRSLQQGRYFFHHGDAALPVPPDALEIVGHHHPAVRCGDQAGTSLKLPALVSGPRRLILPAFSPWAAGSPWNDLAAPEDILWVIAPRRIFPLPRAPRVAAAAR
jgi:metallophosphoesterase superfamily enzyme